MIFSLFLFNQQSWLEFPFYFMDESYSAVLLCILFIFLRKSGQTSQSAIVSPTLWMGTFQGLPVTFDNVFEWWNKKTNSVSSYDGETKKLLVDVFQNVCIPLGQVLHFLLILFIHCFILLVSDH